MDFAKMKVVELKEELRKLGLPVAGAKSVLMSRLEEHHSGRAAEGGGAQGQDEGNDETPTDHEKGERKDVDKEQEVESGKVEVEPKQDDKQRMEKDVQGEVKPGATKQGKPAPSSKEDTKQEGKFGREDERSGEKKDGGQEKKGGGKKEDTSDRKKGDAPGKKIDSDDDEVKLDYGEDEDDEEDAPAADAQDKKPSERKRLREDPSPAGAHKRPRGRGDHGVTVELPRHRNHSGPRPGADTRAAASSHEPTATLHVTGFVRPFTLLAAKAFMSQKEAPVQFWMNKIKSICYATYNSVETARLTREAVDGVEWPPTSKSTLSAHFMSTDAANECIAKAEAALVQPAQPARPTAVQPSPASSRRVVPAAKTAANDAAPPPHPAPEASSLKRQEPPSNKLDTLFRKTTALPQIYYLPAKEVAAAPHTEAAAAIVAPLPPQA